MRNTKKILIGGLSAVILVPILIYLFIPIPYKYSGLTVHGWQLNGRFDFCKYELPESYKFATFRYGESHPGRLIVYQKPEPNQVVILTKFREFLKVPVDYISISNKRANVFHKTLELTYRSERFDLEIPYPFPPFLRIDDIKRIPKELEIRGIENPSVSNFETPIADVFYIQGDFSSIGFYKRKHGIWKYVTPVLKFHEASKGAIAVLTDKNTGETIFAITAVPMSQTFDESEFKQFIQSITFEKEPFQDPFKKSIPYVEDLRNY